MTNNLPAVSVVMVVHNAGEFLAPAVRSVLGQDWQDLEVILFDNGSTDEAVEALLTAVNDPRMRVWRESVNHGIVEATNRATALARGCFVAVMDHDDVALPTKISRQVAWLENHPEAGGVGARTRLIDHAGRELGGDFTLEAAEEYRAFTAFSQSANFGSHLFRRDVIAAFPRRGLFPFSSDFDFVARAVEQRPIVALPEVLFQYRVHPGQTTQIRRREQRAAEGIIRILTAKRRAGEIEPITQAKGWLEEIQTAGDAAAILRACSRRCLACNLPYLAAYHARRSLGAAPGPGNLAAAILLCLRAMSANPRTAAASANLFLRGPLAALRLNPWPRR
jgi:hypothetical protein